jgi:CheY-like chemotaxis protein
VTAKSGGADSGAAFSVVLPIAGKANELLTAAVEQRLSPQMPKIDFNGFHVLLVEDDADSREMLEMALSSFGVRTTAVDNAADALRLVKETRPSLLISDVGLPGEDGYDLIQKVRRLPSEEGGTVPAIALTGYVSLQDRARALEAGYQEHMAKPLEVETLIEMVKDFADKGV